ncbi:O-methylsterigmatocystin oxidoreductase [Rhizoctonia solani]|uniref:O-methylsterigmatocystin oxidoreductase n=1 Tax=Rhizoctonia solani TaxID=456999 RepID=A0A0K6FZG2_9AGAM|nr:O-methylsterigmatocystin oxidoreductase [Rhizoctonia solani]
MYDFDDSRVYTRLVVLNSAEAALELLEKRAALYSDRPPVTMIKDPALMNWPDNAVTIGYNEIWRHYRRTMNVWLNKHSVAQYNDLQDRQAQLLLQQLLLAMDHEQPFEHVKNEILFTVGSSMLQLAYGYEPKSPEDHFLKEVQSTIHNVVSAAMQTNFLVNLFPALLHVPNWFPGTGWKRTGRERGVQQNKAKTEPYEWLRAQIADGTHQPSLLSFLLQDYELLTGLNLEEQDKRLKEIGIALFGAGTDSTASLVANFVATMVLNPRIQARAQLELDTVLGWAVLPRISDQCPGMHFAEAPVFITVASLLATFTFTKKQDSNGEDIIPQIEAERNSIAYELKPFDFQFKPRSEEHRQLILGTNIDEEQG